MDLPEYVQSQVELEELLGVNRSDLHRHLRVKGAPAKGAKGYNVLAVAEWLKKRMPQKGRSIKVPGAEGSDALDDKARREKALADKAEREVARLDLIIAQMKADLVEVKPFTTLMAEIFGRLKADAYRNAREVATATEGKDAAAISTAFSTGVLDKLYQGVQDGITDALERIKRSTTGNAP